MRLHRACPTCGGDLTGTPRKGYYCPACHVLHKRDSLAMRHIRHDLRLLIHEHFSAFNDAPEWQPSFGDISDLRQAIAEVRNVMEEFAEQKSGKRP